MERERDREKKKTTLMIKGKDVGQHSVNECQVLKRESCSVIIKRSRVAASPDGDASSVCSPAGSIWGKENQRNLVSKHLLGEASDGSATPSVLEER